MSSNKHRPIKKRKKGKVGQQIEDLITLRGASASLSSPNNAAVAAPSPSPAQLHFSIAQHPPRPVAAAAAASHHVIVPYQPDAQYLATYQRPQVFGNPYQQPQPPTNQYGMAAYPQLYGGIPNQQPYGMAAYYHQQPPATHVTITNNYYNYSCANQDQSPQMQLPMKSGDEYEDVESVDEFVGPSGIMLRNSEYCKYRYDSESCIVEVDFLKKVEDDVEDNMLIMQLMELDDIALIMNNLSAEGILTVDKLFKDETRSHAKFKIFKRKGWDGRTVIEQEEMVSLRVSEYLQYLKKYEEVAKAASEGQEVDSIMKVVKDGIEVVIDVKNILIYCLDYDIEHHRHGLLDQFKDDFKYPGMLPGGALCMLHHAERALRPNVGPYAFITPAGTYSRPHRDGGGTVDSGHLCISGYNEVIMMRVLSDDEIKDAYKILNGEYDNEPHEGGSTENWPTNDIIQLLKQKGYKPIVFMLKPGQFVHLGKNRLHAFRKMRYSQLPASDCHYSLRSSILQSIGSQQEQYNFSVAYDWQFKGFSGKMTRQMNEFILKMNIDNRKHRRDNLALHESTIIRCARSIMNSFKNTGNISDRNLNHLYGMLPTLEKMIRFDEYVHSKMKDDPNCEDVPYCHSVDADYDQSCTECNYEVANHFVYNRIKEKEGVYCLRCYDEGILDLDCTIMCYHLMSLKDELELLGEVKSVLSSHMSRVL